MDLKSFTSAIQQIADEKGIPREKIIEIIEMALAAAYKRDYGKRGQIVRAALNPETGKASFRQIKIVVDESMIKSEEEILKEEEERKAKTALSYPEEELGRAGDSPVVGEDDEKEEGEEEEKKVRFNPEKHIMLAEAREIKPDVSPGDELEFQLKTEDDYGRIAAQTAKQVIIQRIREAEREAVFDEFKNREGEIVSGLVQRIEGKNVFMDIGRAVGVLSAEEQVPYERYRVGERIKVLITLVEKNPKGPGVFLSRSHPRLIKKLFEIEVPEIVAGTVEIKAIAREPGSRSKVAVQSHDENIDPVGSLVGQKGVRVSTVMNELGGEKIDVIEWSEKQEEFVANAMSPAKVLAVEASPKRRDARVIVPDQELSLAIGKGGQNVRLAAKLTGWKIDIVSDKSLKKDAPAGEDVGEKADSASVEAESPVVSEEVSSEDKSEDKKEDKQENKKEEKPKKSKSRKAIKSKI